MPEELECVNRTTFKIYFNMFSKIDFLATLETHCMYQQLIPILGEETSQRELEKGISLKLLWFCFSLSYFSYQIVKKKMFSSYLFFIIVCLS